jgi:methyl coenzyme M reductase gamma subunit
MTGFVMESPETEDHARYIIHQARTCALGGDSACTINEARYYLVEMLRIQSGCVSGTLVGHDLCDEQEQAAEIVSHLRFKTTSTSTSTTGIEGATTTIAHPKK